MAGKDNDSSGAGLILTVLGASAGCLLAGPVGLAIGAGLGAIAGIQANRELGGSAKESKPSTISSSSSSYAGGFPSFEIDPPFIPSYKQPKVPDTQQLMASMTPKEPEFPLYEPPKVPKIALQAFEPVIPKVAYEPIERERLMMPPPDMPSLRQEPRLPARMDNIVNGIDPEFAPVFDEYGLQGLCRRDY